MAGAGNTRLLTSAWPCASKIHADFICGSESASCFSRKCNVCSRDLMPTSGMPRMTSLISERLRSMVSNTFSACSWATSRVRSISRSAVSRVEIQETSEAKANSAIGRASEAAILHCSSLSELRCSVCTVAPPLPPHLTSNFGGGQNVAEMELAGGDASSPEVRAVFGEPRRMTFRYVTHSSRRHATRGSCRHTIELLQSSYIPSANIERIRPTSLRGERASFYVARHIAGHGRACEAGEPSLRCPNRTSGEIPLH